MQSVQGNNRWRTFFLIRIFLIQSELFWCEKKILKFIWKRMFGPRPSSHTYTHILPALTPPLVLTSLSTSRSGPWNRWWFRHVSEGFAICPTHTQCSILSLSSSSSYPALLLSYTSTPSLQLCPVHTHAVSYLGESAHLVLRQAAAGASWCGGGLPSVPLHTRPNLQVVHPLPEHTIRRQEEEVLWYLGSFSLCVYVSCLL